METKQRLRSVLRGAELIGQLVSRHLTQELNRLRVTDLEAHVLLHLPATGRPVGEVQAVLGVRPSTLTGAIDRLEERGYVRRALNPGDRRSLTLLPTARGVAAASRIRAVADRFDAAVRTRVRDPDVEAFARVVDAVQEVVG